jgi:hypothetical protein
VPDDACADGRGCDADARSCGDDADGRGSGDARSCGDDADGRGSDADAGRGGQCWHGADVAAPGDGTTDAYELQPYCCSFSSAVSAGSTEMLLPLC